MTIEELEEIPAVTSLDDYEDAVRAFKRGGSRSQFMAALFALGMPADAIRYLASFPGNMLLVRER